MEYLSHIYTAWQYLPYLYYPFLAYVFLTLLPKSLGKMKTFANTNYEANRNKYHRCYGPEQCCHVLGSQTIPKPKVRKAVTRVYPKRQTNEDQHEASSSMKRSSAKLSKVHVNEIAKMFENGGTASRKVNRVQPTTVLPELRLSTSDYTEQELVEAFNNNRKFAVQQELLDNIENEANICNQPLAAPLDDMDINWRSEPIQIPTARQAVTQRQQFAAAPTTGTLLFSDGTSATPTSTGSPVDSLLDSPVHMRASPRESTLSLAGGPLNLKSSMEDIFAAIARSAECGGDCGFKFAGYNTLAPVTSIDDILSERRLSRPLSAYSISDLLSEEVNQQGKDGAFMENLLRLSLK